MPTITAITTSDKRYSLGQGEGVDAIHSDPQYSYAVTRLHTDSSLTGVGLAFTLGGGNNLVCQTIEALAGSLMGYEIEELMLDFGAVQRAIADEPQFRWLGPHKGIVHLALSSMTNACFDLWAKSRGVPLWRLLIDLSDQAIVKLLDLSGLEEVLTIDQALQLIVAERPKRLGRSDVLVSGYPGYDTSVGWFNYADSQIRENARRAAEQGFTAVKLKIGSAEPDRDVRRALIVREAVSDGVRIMLDVNQQWSLPKAVATSRALSAMNPFWIEEPLHPDDVLAHRELAKNIFPIDIALGEHVPNKVLFKNFMQAGAMKYVQVDAVRVAGIGEFLTVSLLARKFGLTVVPHVGDMGQIHQHLVLFNHIALGNDRLFLEYIPHLRSHFLHPAIVENGVYRTPQEPGSSSDLLD